MMLENSCRTCLEEIETAPISILTSLFDRTIFNFLCDFASIEMVGVEEQPQNICQTCFEALKNCHSFQQLIIKSDQKLRLQLDNIIKTEQVLEPECTLEIETVEEDFKSDLDEPTLKKAKIKKERVKIECENCSRKFSTKTNLKRHKCISPKNQTASSEENRTLRNRVECADCSKSFLSKMRLSQHSCIALPKAKPYTCTVCLKTFPYKTNLIAHSRIHTGEKPFKCKFCDKTFRFVGAQKLHERTHNEEKAFLCKFCGKGFHQAGQMNVHLRIHTGERPYICAECGRTFSDPSGFTKHRFQHAPVYAPCPICNKVLMKNGIQHHIKQVHIAKRNYSCTHCDKKFISLDVLKGHIRIHDGTKPFQCKICGKCFNQGGTLYNHMRVHTVVQKHKEKVELKAE